ncbi:MAG: hypothetical protein Tsb0017_10630 [Geothermobacteraceae bacterium]
MIAARIGHLCLLLLFLAAAGCARPPMDELASARVAMARAYAAGAPTWAEQEYLAAKAALDKAEDLVSARKYKQARELLPFAEAQARLATSQARQKRTAEELARLAREEEERRLAEEARRKQEEERRRAELEKKKAPARSKPAPPKEIKRYTVAEGDSLPGIAARPEVYGDPLLWPLLYQANRDQLTDPRKIYPGQELTIPRNLKSEELEAARLEARKSPFFPAVKTD